MFEQNKEPEDILSGTDTPPSPQGSQQPNLSTQAPSSINQPAQTRPMGMQGATIPTPPSDLSPELPTSSGGRKLVVLAVVVVVIVIILLAVLVGLWIVRQGKAPVPTEQAQLEDQLLPTDQSADLESQPNSDPIVESEQDSAALQEEPLLPADSDGDGLTDEEETALGTNPQTADSDSDGLSDTEEVRVWNTDPMNPDSDGDGFTDGDEVDNGYDPNQAGGVVLQFDANL